MTRSLPLTQVWRARPAGEGVTRGAAGSAISRFLEPEHVLGAGGPPGGFGSAVAATGPLCPITRDFVPLPRGNRRCWMLAKGVIGMSNYCRAEARSRGRAGAS